MSTLPKHAEQMALDPQKWLESLPDQIRSQIGSDMTTAADPGAYMRKLTNVGWISERQNVPGRVVAQNYDTYLRSFAESNGWGDVWQDDSKFHARVTNDAARERDKRVAREGLPDQTEEGAQLREKSLRNRAYWSAAEGDDVMDDLDMVKGFAAWQKDAITSGSFDPKDAVQNYREWVAAYNGGRAELSAAMKAAKELHPILKKAESGETSAIDEALVVYREMNGNQRAMVGKALTKIVEKETAGDESGLAARSGQVAGRTLFNIARGLDRGYARDRLMSMKFEAGQTELEGSDDDIVAAYLGGTINPGKPLFGGGTLTAERAAKLNENVQKRLQDISLRSELINLAQGTVNPIKRDGYIDMAVLGLAENAPVIGLAASGVGVAALTNSYRNDAVESLMRSGVSAENAQKMGWVIGPMQAAIDRVSLSLLKKAPGLNTLFSKWSTSSVAKAVTKASTGNALSQFAVRAGTITAAEVGVELTQDQLIPALVQDVGNFFDSTIPEVNWRAVKEQMEESAPEVLVSMVLMSAIGAGRATRQDIKNIELLSQDTRAMELLGIPQERIQQIQAGGDAFALFQQGFKERQAAALAGKPVPEPKERPRSESVRLLKEAWTDRTVTEKGDSAARGIGASYEWAQKKMEEKAAIAAKVAPVIQEEDGLFTVEQPDGSPDVVAENAEEAVASSIQAFETQVLNPALEQEETEDAEAEGRPDITPLDTDPPIDTTSTLTRDEENSLNEAAEAVVTRDDEGWKVEQASPQPGTEKSIKTGIGPDGLAAAIEVRDRLAVANLRELQAEREKEQTQSQEVEGLEEAVIGTQTGEVVPAPKPRNENQKEKEEGTQDALLSPLLESEGQAQAAPFTIGKAPEDATPERKAIQDELDSLTADILPSMSSVFSGVEIIDGIPGKKSGGFAYNYNTKALVVSLNDAREAIGKAKDGKKWASASIIEEAIHATVDRLEGEGRINASELMDSLKTDAPKVYGKFREAFKTGSDADAAQEFMRMLVQGRASFKIGEGLVLNGELTEMQFTPRILRELTRVLRQVLAVIRDLQGRLPAELATELDTARLLVEDTLRQVIESQDKQQTPSGGATAEGGDTAVLRKPSDGNGQEVLSSLEQLPPRPGNVKSENEQSGLLEPQVWAAKNAATDAQRVRMGLQPRMAVMARQWGAVWSQAMQAIENAAANGRNLADKILTEFRDESRILEDWEIAVMTHELVTRETNYEAMKQQLTEAKTDTARNEIYAKINELQFESDNLFNAIQETGTRTARALAIRKLMINDRWEIVKMRSDLMANQGGKPLTPEQSAMVEETQKKIVAVQQKQEAREEEILGSQIDRDMAAFFTEIKKALKGKDKKKSNVRAALKKQADEARARLAESRQKLGAGSQIFDPKWYRDSIIVLASDLVELGSKAVDMVKLIAEKFGEEVTPEEASRMKADADALIDSLGLRDGNEVAKAKGKVKAQQDIEALDGEGLPSRSLVYNAVTIKVRDGMDNPQEIMEAVHSDLRGSWPELTERQVKEIFTDYGKASFPDKDELKRTVRELNVLVTQILHIERMQEGEPPLKKGYQRDKPSQQIRAMYKRVSELKKRLGMNRRSDAQIASALDAAKTRLRNEIEDLNAWLEQGGRTDQQKAPKTGVEYDAEATELVKHRDELKEALVRLEGPTPLKFEQIVEQTLKALDKTEEALTRRLTTGDFAAKKKAGAPVLTPEIEEKLSYIATLREAVSEGRKALEGDNTALGQEKAAAAAYLRARDEYSRRVREGDVMPTGREKKKQTAMSQETAAAYTAMQEARQEYLDLRLERQAEINLATDKINARKRIEKLEERIRNKDFVVKKKAEREQDDELMELKLEEFKVKQKWVEGLLEEKMKRFTLTEQAWSSTANALGWARAIMTGWDFSALGRQAGFLLVARPLKTLKAVVPGLKALWSEAYALNHQESILDSRVRRNAPLYIRDKLSLTTPFLEGASLEKAEEQFRTRWLTQPPRLLKLIINMTGGSKYGALGLLQRGTIASSRAYSVVLNQVRADFYDAISEGLSKTGIPTAEEGKRIAGYINMVTGRANVAESPKTEKVLTAMNSLFFAPRYVVSRFQTITLPFKILFKEILHGTGVPLAKIEKSGADLRRVDRYFLREYARYLRGVAALWALTVLMGSGDDDDDKDRMELNVLSSRFMRIQVGRNFLDPFAGLSQVLTFMARMTTGKLKDPSGEIEDRERGNTLLYFLRSKASPITGSLWDLLAGKDIRQEEADIGTSAARLVTPMAMRDVIETFQTQDNPGKAILIVFAALSGISVQNYQDDSREDVAEEDLNFLYRHGIGIPEVRPTTKAMSIAGFRAKSEDSPWAKPLTPEQRKKLLSITLPEVDRAVSNLRKSFKDAPKDDEAYMEFRKDQKKVFQDRVKRIRKAAIYDVMKD